MRIRIRNTGWKHCLLQTFHDCPPPPNTDLNFPLIDEVGDDAGRLIIVDILHTQVSEQRIEIFTLKGAVSLDFLALFIS